MSLLSFNFCFAKVKLAIIDTGFCSNPREELKKIKIYSSLDATGTIKKLDCPKDYLNLDRFHGENVLKTFLEHINENADLEIYPIIVYDNRALTNAKYWLEALGQVEKLKIKIVLSATGLKLTNIDPLEKKLKLNNSLYFLSAPRISPVIREDDEIFPQNHFFKKNVFLFAHYLEGDLFDSGLLYKEHISAYTIDSKLHFNGSSYAMPVIAGNLLSKCSSIKEADLVNCIKKNLINFSLKAPKKI